MEGFRRVLSSGFKGDVRSAQFGPTSRLPGIRELRTYRNYPMGFWGSYLMDEDIAYIEHVTRKGGGDGVDPPFEPID
jgi:hypothetical protein